MYEMFLDKSGKKISKSYGNVFTPQVWFKYGSPKSLILLMFKRFEGTRELDVTDIPKYMDELLRLERIYFGLEKVKNERELINSKRLFEYVHFFKPPKKLSLQIPYMKLVEIAKILPEKNRFEFAVEKLKELGLIKKLSEKEKKELEERLRFATNWVKDFERKAGVLKLTDEEKKAVKELIEVIKKEENGEKIQTRIFEIARENGIKPKKFFKILYRIILKDEKGPRLGPYIIEVGKEEIIRKLLGVL